MARFQWETPLDRLRADEREDERAEAIRRLRAVEREQEQRPPPLEFGPSPSPSGMFVDRLDELPQTIPQVLERGVSPLLAQMERPGSVIIPDQPDFNIEPLLQAEEFGRGQVKRHVVEPIVPTFDFGRATLPKPPGIVQEAVLEIAGVPEEEQPAIKRAVEEAKPLGIQVSSATVEEAASWVLDPTNLAFFAGPALKGAGGAARVANQIRKTGSIPNFVRAAMRVSTEETATGVARPWIMGLRAERDATRSTIEALRTSGKKELIPELESWLTRVEADLVRAEGRGIAAPGADIAAGVAPTAEELTGLAGIRAATVGPEAADIGAARARPLEAPLEADVFAERGVVDIGARPGAQIPAEEGLISSQVLEPPPPGTLPGAPSILSTRLPDVRTPLDNVLAKLGGEAGGGVGRGGLQAERSIRQELGVVENIGDESWIFADGAIVDISEGSRKLPTARIDATRDLLGERYGGYFHTDVSIRYLPPEDRAAFYRELDELAESPSDLLQFDWDARNRFGKFTEAVSIQKQTDGTLDIVVYGPLSPQQKVGVEQAVRDAKTITQPSSKRYLLEDEARELGYAIERVAVESERMSPLQTGPLRNEYWSIADPSQVKTIPKWQGHQIVVDTTPDGITRLNVTPPSEKFNARIASPEDIGPAGRVTAANVRAKLDEFDQVVGPGTFPGPEAEGVVFKKPTKIGPIEEAVPTGLSTKEAKELDRLQGIKGKLSNRQTARLSELEAKSIPPEPPAPNPFEVGGFSRTPTQMRGPRSVGGGPAPDDLGGFSRGGGGGRIGGGGVVEGGPPFEGSEGEEAIAKLTQLINQAQKPRRGQTLLQHEELQRRFKVVSERLRTGEGTPEEIAARAKAALGGPQPKAQFEPVRPFMTESEVQSLFARANTFDFGFNKAAENVRVVDALTKILTGTLPQQAEMELLERVFGAELVGALQAKGPLGPKIYRNVVDLLSLPKTALTILDHSFPGRQGIKLAPSHPLAWKDSFWQGLRAMRSKQVTQDLVVARATDSTPILVREGDTVKTIPFGQFKEMIGVYEAPFGPTVKISEREEAFISRWARLIPGVQLSERAFLTSGNEIRHSVVRGLLMEANRGNIPIELKQAEALANLVNRASGRGTLGPLNELAPVLNGLMFAPRYRVSSPEWAATILNFGNPRAQKEAVKEIISFVGTGVGVLALLDISGLATVNVDPTSADFGKGKVGNTRIDFWAHMQQIARSVAMLYEGERQTSTGERVSIGREEVAYRYFRSGLSPFAGLLEDVRTGETIAGEELEGTPSGLGTQAFNRLVPLVWQDIVEGVREEGIRGGIISSLALGGIGVQTYETFAQQRAIEFQKETGMEFDYNNSGHWAILRTNKNLVEKFGELGDQAQETQDFLTKEMEGLALPEMAQKMSSGSADPQVYLEFREAWEDFEGIRANAAARMAFGRDRDPAEDKAFQAYIGIDRNDPKYKDPVTLEIDYGAYRRDKDAAFKGLDSAIQEAFLQVGAPDPGVARWATLYTVARNLRRDLYAMSKWEGLTPEQSRQLDQFSLEVRKRAPQIAAQLGRRVKEADVARFLAEQQGLPGLAEWFIGLQSSTERDKRRSTEYGLFLAENVAGLRLFYPELYSQASLERIGLIEGEEPSGVQPVQPQAPVEPVAPIGGVR